MAKVANLSDWVGKPIILRYLGAKKYDDGTPFAFLIFSDVDEPNTELVVYSRITRPRQNTKNTNKK